MLHPADDAFLTNLIKNVEGGYIDDPVDRGGATNMGITQETLGNWRHLGRLATKEEVRDLMETEARDIYAARYIEGPGFDRISSDRLREFIVDTWVNHTPKGATLVIQRALKIPGDGIMGPKTLQALIALGETFGATFLLGMDALIAERARYYSRIITNSPSQAKYAAGWIDRVMDFLSPN